MKRPLTQRGFTLVEALVSLMLLALLALGGVALLPTLNRLATTSERLQYQAAELGRLHDFTRAVFSAALTPSDLGDSGRELQTLRFTAEQADFIAPLPPGLGAGLYRIEMATRGPAGRQDLVLRLQSLRPDGPPPAEGILLAGAKRLTWSFFDRTRKSWSDGWREAGRLPDLIRLDVEMPNSDPWPPLIVRSKVNGGPLCAFDPVIGTCRRSGQ